MPGPAGLVLRAGDGTTSPVDLGDVTDVPVTGDWDGDGVTDLGVYDQAAAVFTLRLVDRDGLTWTAEVPFGTGRSPRVPNGTSAVQVSPSRSTSRSVNTAAAWS